MNLKSLSSSAGLLFAFSLAATAASADTILTLAPTASVGESVDIGVSISLEQSPGIVKAFVASSFTLNFGDGQSEVFSIADQSAQTIGEPQVFSTNHSYLSAGTYTVSTDNFIPIFGLDFVTHPGSGGDALRGLTYLVQASETVQINAVAGAVPEPSTWALMLFGFAGVAFVGFRRRKSIAPYAA